MVGRYSVVLQRTSRRGGMRFSSVVVRDKYNARRYWIERRMVRVFTTFLRTIVSSKPLDEANTPQRTLASWLAYIPPGMRAWRGYMPGGFATYHVHAPEVKGRHTRVKLDAITRRFFRHTYDAVGLRSRAYILSWIALAWAEQSKLPVRWLSIAGGSGLPVYEIFADMPEKIRKNARLKVADIDQTTLDFAAEIYDLQGISIPEVSFECIDICNTRKRRILLESYRPSIVDAMGLFEYLDKAPAISLIKAIYKQLPKGGIFVFTNMSPEHPDYAVHKKALQWPGVIARSESDIAQFLKKAKIPLACCQAYRAHDKVYTVYKVEK